MESSGTCRKSCETPGVAPADGPAADTRCGVLAPNVYTFSRLTDESPIAGVSFAKQGARQAAATISHGDFCSPQVHLW